MEKRSLYRTAFKIYLGIFNYLNRKKIAQITSNENYLLVIKDGKEIKTNLKSILYINSEDNYVNIHFLERNGERQSILYRSSLKNVEDQIVNPLSGTEYNY